MSIASLIGPALLFTAALPTQEEESSADALGTWTHAELSARLSNLADAHPDLCTLHLVGTSREGRSIEALRITAADEPSQHPAILLVANLEGPRSFESGVALHHAARLLADQADSETVRALLASTVVWVLPRANPDAAEARFQEPRAERWAAAHGVDDDRDGRVGEDPAADLNGDGLVTLLRVADPEGEWMEDPTDARALVKADPTKGERGRWKLHPEARDLDGDGEVGEDPLHDARVDRNFAAGWEEHAAHAGRYPTDEPETRALCEFVMAHPNLVLVVVYDGLDNLVESPKGVDDDARPVKRIPPAGVLASDAKLLAKIGADYREATGNETTSSGEDAGTFGRWCYEHRGLTTLQAVLWELPTEAPKSAEDAGEDDGATQETDAEESEDEDAAEEVDAKPSADAQHLRWIDATGETWRFVDWTPFEHPELGPVELGGFAPFARYTPPEEVRRPLADAHFDWFVGLGDLLPRLTLTVTRSAKADGLHEVEAVLSNEGYLPLLSRSARRTRTTRPVRLTLQLPQAARLLAGTTQELVSDLPGSGGRAEFTWLVHGPAEMELGVALDSDHAGELFAKAEVSR